MPVSSTCAGSTRDGSIGFYSSSSRTSKSRPAWDFIKECTFKREKNSRGEEHDYFIFKNRGHEKKAFRIDELNPVLWALNDFTALVIKMRTTNEDKLLALYLSLMVKSSMFCCHEEFTHDKDGFRVDGAGLSLKDLEEVSGSLQSYREFVEKGINCCLDVSKRRDVLEKLEGGKPKVVADDLGPKVKRSKVEKVMDSRDEELNSNNGIEKNYINQYLGRADVSLSNLAISKKVSMPINPYKVQGLARAMRERFDPSQISLTVVPLDPGELTAENMASKNFQVIHGRHRYSWAHVFKDFLFISFFLRLLSILELDKKGQLTSLRGMENKMITCHIVRGDNAVQANYGAMRGNDCQAEGVHKPFVHELVFVLEGLAKQFGNEKAIEAVERYGKALAFGYDEIAASNKMHTLFWRRKLH